MVNFGDNCCFINRFKPAVYKVNDVSSSWKMDVLLWNEKKGSLFMIFGTSMMILHNTALKRPFPKLKKHSPTRLYMLYPMAQSVVLVCVEIDKKMAPQGAMSIVINIFTVGAANNTPACQQGALPARYRRTASISTYPHIMVYERLQSFIAVRSFLHCSQSCVRFCAI
jgi:hypothetical protein